MEYTRNEYLISNDPNKLDLDIIHQFLNRSYWAPGINKTKVQKAIDNSLCFGLYSNNEQIGFARVVSDYTSFAYLADVFVLEEHRGKGLATWMLEKIIDYPTLQDIKRFMLATHDAHKLYEKFGFLPLRKPEMMMEKPLNQ